MNTTAPNTEAPDQTDSGAKTNGHPAEMLRRPAHDRMLAGVAAGIARYLGVDVTIVRIVLVVLTFAGGAGVPLYLAGWLLIPEEGSDQSLASELIGSLYARSR